MSTKSRRESFPFVLMFVALLCFVSLWTAFWSVGISIMVVGSAYWLSGRKSSKGAPFLTSNSETQGYVYALSNSSMPGMLKIGMTCRSPYERALELKRSTGVPTDFKVEITYKTKRPMWVEKELHRFFASKRVNANREFFAVQTFDVKEAINVIEGHSAKVNIDTNNFFSRRFIRYAFLAACCLITEILILSVIEGIKQPKPSAETPVVLKSPNLVNPVKIKGDFHFRLYYEQLMESKEGQMILSKEVQRRLKLEGFYKGGIDGDFGPQSQKALANFIGFKGSEVKIGYNEVVALKVDLNAVRKKYQIRKDARLFFAPLKNKEAMYKYLEGDVVGLSYCDTPKAITNVREIVFKSNPVLLVTCLAYSNHNLARNARYKYYKYVLISGDGSIDFCGYKDITWINGTKTIKASNSEKCSGLELGAVQDIPSRKGISGVSY